MLESLLILPLKTIKTRRQKYLSRHLALVRNWDSLDVHSNVLQ